MKKILPYCIILLLSLLLSFTLVRGALWEDTVENGETFNTPLGEFSARLFESEGFISFFGEGYSIRLFEGECSSEGNYKFCFDSKSEKEYDYKRDKSIYQLNLRIDEVKPTISISIDQDELLIGETAIISVNVQNHEDQRMKYIYEDKIPSNFEIIESNKIKFSRNTVSDTKILDKSTDSFSYTIKKIKEGKALLNPQLEYLYEGEYIDAELGSIEINDKSRLNIDADLSSKNVELLQDVALDIELESRVIDKDLEVKSLEIEIPDLFLIREYNDTLNKNGNNFRWSGILRDNEVEFSFILSPKKLGEANISLRAIVQDGEDIEEIEDEIQFSTKFDELDLTLNMPSKIFQSRNLIKADYENRNKLTEFKNINCEMTGLFNATYIIKTGRPDIKTIIEDSYFWIANDTPADNYTQILNCIYELPNQETMFETEIKNITLNLTPEEEINEVEIKSMEQNETINESIEINETKLGIFKRFWGWVTGENKEDIQKDMKEDNAEIKEVEDEEKQGIFRRFLNWIAGKNKEDE